MPIQQLQMHSQLPRASAAATMPTVACPQRALPRLYRLHCAASAATDAPSSSSASPSIDVSLVKTKRILVLGGSGRVGSSTAASLLDQGIGSHITIANRSQDNFNNACSQRPQLRDASFTSVDIDDPSALLAALKGMDLVVHTAGPFQRKEQCAVLEAAIASGVAYMDVCDDMEYSQRAKTLHKKAEAEGVPAITTAGIYPGVSNLMAAHMVSVARWEYDERFAYRQPAAGEGVEPVRVLYSYFTAGTGGAGPTILETSMLLAGEDVVAFKDGQRVELPAVSNMRVVDYGKGLGRRSAFLYNLPEVLSGHQVMRVPSISARFGTDPELWNIAMWLSARLLPKSFLSNREAVRGFVSLIDPLVRPLDALVGERVGMKVEVDLADGTNATALFLHNRLSDSVGICNAAFAYNMLVGGCSPGVYFPEEQAAVRDRLAVLQMASQGTTRFLLNKAAWELDTEPVKVIVRVTVAGLCGSDIHLYTGKDDTPDAGTIMGHEFVGIVHELGASVTTLAVGDRVVAPFTTCCGDCFFCRHALPARCTQGQVFGWRRDGAGLHGAQAQFVRVPLADTTLVKVSSLSPVDAPLTDRQAVLLGDIIPTGLFAAEQGGVGPASGHCLVAVVGCGPVGLMGVCAALYKGAATVLAIDMVEERRALAGRFGAVPVDANGDVEAAIAAATEGRGVDVAMEMVGDPKALQTGLKLCRAGGTVSSIGVYGGAETMPVRPVELYNKNITLRHGRCPARRLMEEAARVAQRFPVLDIVSHVGCLGEGPALYDAFCARRGCTMKVLFEFGKE